MKIVQTLKDLIEIIEKAIELYGEDFPIAFEDGYYNVTCGDDFEFKKVFSKDEKEYVLLGFKE
jgi:hypothetical protein